MRIRQFIHNIIDELTQVKPKSADRIEKLKVYIVIVQKYNFETNEYKNNKVELFTDPCKAIEFYEKNQPCELVSKELKI